jgi:hypothetical protein
MKLSNFNEDGTAKPVPVRNFAAEISAVFKKAYGASVSQMIPSPTQFNELYKLLETKQKKREK